MKLTKSMYGDLKCKAFGLSNNQMRGNSIINNAGWYNLRGEKLGNGDLNLTDMENIAKTISLEEAFVVLAEMDAMWNMPSTLDHTAPGTDYVMQKAIWMIGKDAKGGNAIIRIRENISKSENAEQDGVKYYRFPREELYKSLNYSPKKIELSAKTTVKKDAKTLEEKMKDAVNKLNSLKPTKSVSVKSTPSPSPVGSVNYIGGGSITKINPAPTPSAPKKLKKSVSVKRAGSTGSNP
jgi:hypothetical protein